MADHRRTELPLEALRMALTHRSPAPDMIHHPDRGCQYTFEAYTDVLTAHRIRSSLSRPRNCCGKAVAESLFAALKSDLVYRRARPTGIATRSVTFEYIDGFYNSAVSNPPSATSIQLPRKLPLSVG